MLNKILSESESESHYVRHSRCGISWHAVLPSSIVLDEYQSLAMQSKYKLTFLIHRLTPVMLSYTLWVNTETVPLGASQYFVVSRGMVGHAKG